VIGLKELGLEHLQPKRVTSDRDWLGHTPFAYYLIKWLQPKLFVELGVRRGVSYCAFLQAIKYLGIECTCYGVDHWQGDSFTASTEDDYNEIKAYHDPEYSDFSTLLKMPFDEALELFDEESIDLLHIDGDHTAEAVKNDFETWMPKMSKEGIILLHDVAGIPDVRDYFISELQPTYRTCMFWHSFGLGVVQVGSEINQDALWELLECSPSEQETIKQYFNALGALVNGG
jgi:hypothetical protein